MTVKIKRHMDESILSLEEFMRSKESLEIRQCVSAIKRQVHSQPVKVSMLHLRYLPDECLNELSRAAKEFGRHGDGILLADISPDMRAYLLIKDILPRIPAELSKDPLDKFTALRTFYTGSGISIAVVEDDLSDYQQVAAPLLLRGYTVNRIAEESETRTLSANNGVILSLDLRKLNSLDILSRLKKIGTPVLAMGVLDDSMTEEKARMLGAVDVVKKPCPDEAIVKFASGLARNQNIVASRNETVIETPVAPEIATAVEDIVKDEVEEKTPAKKKADSGRRRFRIRATSVHLVLREGI